MKWGEDFGRQQPLHSSGHGVPGDSSSMDDIILGKQQKPELEIRCLGCGSEIINSETAYYTEEGKGPYCTKYCNTEKKQETTTSES